MFRVLAILVLSLDYCFASPMEVKRGFTATLPITKRTGMPLQRRQKSAAIGIGDNSDAEYSVQIQVGETSLPVILDTGSSDLWAVSTDCSISSCGSLSSIPKISTASFNASGFGIEFDYGDSFNPTFARGKIVSGPVSIAGIQVQSQFLSAVNSTNTGLPDQGLAGIFGAGFPSGSDILLDRIPSLQTDPQFTDKFIGLLPAQAPLLSRLVLDGQLAQPMYTITLQRETIELGGNVGQLTIGQLPEGVSNNSLTWVPVRLYTVDQGGLPGPSSNPNLRFPLRWEVTIDDVFLDGQKLPQPTLPTGTGYTALIDSGTSVLAGPENTVNAIYSAISTDNVNIEDATPTISCSTPVNLTFMIGGKLFPVDPRDFLSQQPSFECDASSLSITDPPGPEALMSWILGTVFMKSTLVAFYFGDIKNPAADPPRMGFLSTVPSDADAALKADAQSASTDFEGFLITSVSAPTGTFTATTTNSLGVAQAPVTVSTSTSTISSGGARPSSSSGGSGGGSSSGSGSGQNAAIRVQVPHVFIASLISALFYFF